MTSETTDKFTGAQEDITHTEIHLNCEDKFYIIYEENEDGGDVDTVD